MIELTHETEAMLMGVNHEVNANIKYRDDVSLYEKVEFWTVVHGIGEGDCEDYALTKRQLLIGLGLPPEDLRLATCWTETNEYHAVLTVETDKATLVLDNRFPYPYQWDVPNYRWHKRQKPGRLKWELLTGSIPDA